MVTLPMLIDALERHVSFTRSPEDNFRQFQGIFLVDGETVCQPDMLYVGTSDMIERLLIRSVSLEGITLISTGSSDRLSDAPGRGALLLASDLELVPLYNRLMQVFLQYEAWQRVFSNGACHTLKRLLALATGQINFSVLLLGAGYQVIAHSVQEEDRDVIALTSGEEESVAQRTLTELLSRVEHNEHRTVMSPARKVGYVYALAPICRGSTVLGYLFACSTGKSSILRSMMYVLAQFATELLVNREEVEAGTDTFQTLAAQFLNDQTNNLEELEVRLHQLPNRPKRFMRGVVIRMLNTDGNPTPVYAHRIQQIFDIIESMFPADNAAILDECIYLMLSDDCPDAPVTITKKAEFEALLRENNAFAMVANPSQRLRGVRALYRQSFQVLPIAAAVRYQNEVERRCLRFDRYSPYYIIYLCEKSVVRELGVDDILYLCHPAILTITRHDRAFHSNLRDTLFTYLMNDRSISETSRCLFMHRNTTIYKLGKIEKLIGSNLDDPYMRHQLILSCMIIRYVEKYRRLTVELPPLDTSLLKK